MGQSKISVNGIELCFSFYSGYLLSAVNPQVCLQGCSHTARWCKVPLIPRSHGPEAAQRHLRLHCKCTFGRTVRFHWHSHPQLRSFLAAHSPRERCAVPASAGSIPPRGALPRVASRGGIVRFVQEAKFHHRAQPACLVCAGQFFHCIHSGRIRYGFAKLQKMGWGQILPLLTYNRALTSHCET